MSVQVDTIPKVWLVLVLGTLVVLGGVLFSLCEKPTPPAPPPDLLREATSVPNGLSEQDRKLLYTTPEGSELLPLWLFNLLEDPDTEKPFRDNLERFGFVYTSPRGPFPIGFTVSPSPDLGVKMVGLNCSACHVGEVHYQGQRLQIDGAPNRFDIQRFYREMLSAIEPTLKSKLPRVLLKKLQRATPQRSPDVLTARSDSTRKEELEQIENVVRMEKDWFQKRYEKCGETFLLAGLLGKPHSCGESRVFQSHDFSFGRTSFRKIQRKLRLLFARVTYLQTMVARSEKDTEPLAGRVDAFGFARNTLFGAEYGTSPNRAPISYPHLWGIQSAKWVHWNGNTNSIVERNIGQAIGVGAIVDIHTHETSVMFENLHQLEKITYKINAPRWPDMFPSINKAQADRGKKLFEKHCLSCHKPLQDRTDREHEPYLLSVVGTDPMHARQFAMPVGNKPFAERLGQTLGAVKRHYFDTYNISEEVRNEWEDDRGPTVWRSPMGYIARPLDGVWATAPYLHNNSVPTLYHLLLPPAKRPKEFSVAGREYDPKYVGYVFDLPEGDGGDARFDTKERGNSNAGHEFGTLLSDEDRWALVEYLKSL